MNDPNCVLIFNLNHLLEIRSNAKVLNLWNTLSTAFDAAKLFSWCSRPYHLRLTTLSKEIIRRLVACGTFIASISLYTDSDQRISECNLASVADLCLSNKWAVKVRKNKEKTKQKLNELVAHTLQTSYVYLSIRHWNIYIHVYVNAFVRLDDQFCELRLCNPCKHTSTPEFIYKFKNA